MEIEKIEKVIFDQVCFIQSLSGRDVPHDFRLDLIPLDDMEGFDSINGAEAAVRIAAEVGSTLAENPFVDGNRPLTIKQVAININKKIEGK